MKPVYDIRSKEGFSMTEMLLCVVIMIPIMSAAVSLFSVGVEEHSSEQSSVDVNQEARTALEMMAQEIAQAGSHRDRSTVLTGAVTNPNPDPLYPQTVAVSSSAGLVPGDYVDVGAGTGSETVKLLAVGTNTITAPFRFTKSSGDVVRLFAFPFVDGMIPPSGIAANAFQDVTALRFFGDINTDIASGANSELQYIEYVYDSANDQITRSVTPVKQSTKNAAIPFIRNVKDNSVRFRIYTDALRKVTSVDIAFTVQTNWKTASHYQETPLSTKVVIPSVRAGSILLQDFEALGGLNKLPPKPAKVNEWAG